MKMISNYYKREYRLNDYLGCEIYKVVESDEPTRYEIFHPNDDSLAIYYFDTLKEAKEWAREWARKH